MRQFAVETQTLGEMGLAAICCPELTTESDKLEDIWKQREESGECILHHILSLADFCRTPYINRLSLIDCEMIVIV